MPSPPHEQLRAPQAPLRPGYVLEGRYELLMPFARGGMATVWAGRVQRKHGFEKLVAIKTMHPNLAVEPAFRNMFLDEARIASRVRHTNVATIEDLGEEGGTLYIVMEWVQGDSLGRLHHAMAQRGPEPIVDVFLRVLADAAAGLHAAHELRGDDGALLGVVHRDVSPQNIMVTDTGLAKVIDFGIAKAVGRLAENTRTGLIKAKIEYASPEQARVEPCDRRADVWALGMTLYQLLTGDLPYRGRNDVETLQKLTSGAPPPPLPPSVPPAVVAIVARALQHDRDKRFPTALEMSRALEAAIGAPTSSEQVANVQRAYLASRMQERKQKLTQALAEAAERAGLPPPRAPFPSSHDAPPGEMRERFPTLPPEVIPSSPAIQALPTAAAGPAGALSEARALAPRLRLSHVILVVLVTLVTAAVWSMVVRVYLRAGASHAAEPPGRSAPRHAG
jgi:eukaryotic-like serine/threonine-protein kinase